MSTTSILRSQLLRRLAIGVVVVLVAATIFAIFTNSSGSPTVTAVFANASPLQTGNLVKANGVVVGKVTTIKLVDGQAHVGLSLSHSILPLHQDASATIEPISLLGERFVSLNPGTKTAPDLAAPEVIQAAHTGSDVNLDQVLNTLNQPTSAALATLLATLGTGLEGQGANVDNAVKALTPAMTQTGDLVKILQGQDQLLGQLVSTAAPAAQAVDADHGQDLTQLVNSATQTLSTISANRQSLDATLNELPATLANAEATLSQLAGVADTTTPVLQSIKPVTDNLDSITQELHAVANAANPALARLPAVLSQVDLLLKTAAPVVQQLGTGSRSLDSDVNELYPLGAQLLFHPSNQVSTLDTLMNGVANWAMTTSSYDSLGNFFRGAALFSTIPGSALGILGQTATPTPTPAATTGNGTTNAAKPAASTPASSTANNPLASLLPNLNQALNATGLTQNQESGLLGELLGGL